MLASEQALAAVDAALNRQMDPQEREWVERIEALRMSLKQSTDGLTQVDYGAGDPNLTLSEAEMYTGRTVQRALKDLARVAKPHLFALVLMRLVRELKPTQCLELGTSLGISASYQASGLELNRHGSLITLEGATTVADLAKRHFSELGLSRIRVVVGRFQDELGPVLDKLERVDFAFIDGHHDEQATLRYFDALSHKLSRDAVVVFDDIAWSEGMKRAWNQLRNDPRMALSIDLRAMGVCVTGKISGKPPTVDRSADPRWGSPLYAPATEGSR